MSAAAPAAAAAAAAASKSSMPTHVNCADCLTSTAASTAHLCAAGDHALCPECAEFAGDLSTCAFCKKARKSNDDDDDDDCPKLRKSDDDDDKEAVLSEEDEDEAEDGASSDSEDDDSDNDDEEDDDDEADSYHHAVITSDEEPLSKRTRAASKAKKRPTATPAATAAALGATACAAAAAMRASIRPAAPSPPRTPARAAHAKDRRPRDRDAHADRVEAARKRRRTDASPSYRRAMRRLRRAARRANRLTKQVGAQMDKMRQLAQAQAQARAQAEQQPQQPQPQAQSVPAVDADALLLRPPASGAASPICIPPTPPDAGTFAPSPVAICGGDESDAAPAAAAAAPAPLLIASPARRSARGTSRYDSVPLPMGCNLCGQMLLCDVSPSHHTTQRLPCGHAFHAACLAIRQRTATDGSLCCAVCDMQYSEYDTHGHIGSLDVQFAASWRAPRRLHPSSCMMCFDDIPHDAIMARVDTCGHVFHRTCLISYGAHTDAFARKCPARSCGRPACTFEVIMPHPADA